MIKEYGVNKGKVAELLDRLTIEELNAHLLSLSFLTGMVQGMIKLRKEKELQK